MARTQVKSSKSPAKPGRPVIGKAVHRRMSEKMHDNEMAAVVPAAESRADEELTTDLDVEMALLALSAQDIGEPTESFDLSSLSPTEKRVLLEMLRKRLYGSGSSSGTPGGAPGQQPSVPAETPARDTERAVA